MDGIKRKSHIKASSCASCDSSGEKMEDTVNSLEKRLLSLGVILFAAAVWGRFPPMLSLALYLGSYLVIGGRVLKKAALNITRGRVFDENLLMSIATIGAIAIGEYPEAVAVMLFYRVGEGFQEAAVKRSRASIRAMMDIRPDKANLLRGSEVLTVAPESVKVGEIIVVRPGERVPLDGFVMEGFSHLDTSALTGEAMPRSVESGDEVLSGSVNGTGLLKLNVTRPFGDSTVSRILNLVQEAAEQKAPTEQFITKFARIYTPLVVLLALFIAVLPPIFIPGAVFSDWLYRALVFLVISCPCALVISIPLAFFGGIGGASRRGILVKGGNCLEALNQVDTVIFDKTGTLTKGTLKVSDVISSKGFLPETVLKFAAYGEVHSSHPIANSILKAYGQEVLMDDIKGYEEVPGLGVKAELKGESIVVGSSKLLNKEGILCDINDDRGTIVHIGVDGRYGGYLVISDEIKPDARAAVDALKDIGIEKMAILSGDRGSAVARIADLVGIDDFYGELLPHQKVEIVREKVRENLGGRVAFVGDGMNDAPVLAMADVGIAMGGLGSDAAIEAADVVLMTDEPMKIFDAIKIARKTRRIVLQNIILALGIKGIVLILGAAGIATMWGAVFADVGAALLAVLNSVRVLKND